ncbi:hypothetical protein OG883_42780 [Streptomyces sp. NBC_01142]|uniref:hypothetical protein n=1 Tax=Streptomyces sp. NBC_01142 TaxID=2975865 RepID=UPI00224CC3D5|nr:hypothetical protein [Streptomyces sp. NBC_01142]MCX4826370.1 hypothetical protein [Streptomyces sp. NBC_01142]
MTVVERLAPDDARGRCTDIWASTMGISALIAPLISSAALDAGGPELMWTTSLALGVLAAVCLALKRHIDTPSTPRRPTLRTWTSRPPARAPLPG